MRLVRDVGLALRRLRQRPVRSLLVLQGTIWGVAVSLFPTAVLDGTRAAVAARGADVGADRLAVTLDPTRVGPRPLVPADVDAVTARWRAAGIPVEGAAGVALARARDGVGPGPTVPAAALLGPGDAFAARGLALVAGRAGDPGAARLEAVVEAELAAALAPPGGARALGADVTLPDGRVAAVVGVLAPRGAVARRTNDLGFDTEHPVFRGATGKLLASLGVPFGDDAWKRTDRCAWVAARPETVDWIFLRAPPDRLREASPLVEAALHDAGKDVVLFRAFFYSLLLHRDVDRFHAVSLALFVACLAMSAVVMAAVGLLTALSRAAEVAVHRVEGATRRDVVAQFLAEGLVLSVVGSLLGWALGCGLAELRVALEPLAGMTWAFPWAHALGTLAAACVVGGLATLLPAWRAASRAPVEALVDE